MRILVTGLIAQHPALGGMTWHYLQYLVGLRQLGHDVYYFEDSGEWPYRLADSDDPDTWVDQSAEFNLRHIDETLTRFGFGDRWAYRLATTGEWYGLSAPRRREVVESADLLLNVSGSLARPGLYRRIPRMAYIDTDPTFTQVRLQTKTHWKLKARVAVHDVHFTFGERLDRPSEGDSYRWLATRQPVILEEWRTDCAPRDVFTTVMSWTSFEPLVHNSVVYAQKDAEFQHYVDLPSLVAPTVLEVAFSSTPHTNWQSAGGASRESLRDHGWSTVNATEVCSDVDSYRSYIQTSRAEWTVAKGGYVVGQSGWFSDRSACYLAAGRPVVVQDTGLRAVLPVGEGLLVFTTPEEAAAAILEVQENYEHHAHRARSLAHEYFDARIVLNDLVERALL